MPKNETRDTKEVIVTVALKLFSEKGYDGVGIRDISKEIGIRESALYRHYSGKKDIFDSLLKDIDRRYQEEVSTFIPPESVANILSEESDVREELFGISITMFQFYLKTEYGSQLRRMLTMEQYRNSEASKFFRELIIDKGLDYISGVFTDLINTGIYVEADPMVMALQFYSPLYLLLSKYDNQPEKYEEALSFLEKHITTFNKTYLRSDKQ
ncbi:TetR/AcrR family transcriptional regulator [Anaerotignum propionicum]|uniref:Biofilm operon icaADBC HTH-type negative transcriptional regulator IcaR n=1 Tax=Anaerotignum propionicum DSM 1682 TaxID=991789 RepID=A0A0X8V9J8_ANAPI|nr:TetR/AcrR family transcriptional regulator [Anaerotignum propionicum]AMJ39949.1 biofilm operon icaADBC HTH-type negative transcriptional regulator IcaR [Anaerotignum propionicum DSM 1682]SHE27136.1 transcriptional regulator, TetR family [[Clostridium] propionicum DSM 1682] [Anaerotignum propionicum DSM 1682]